jgi:hypothetical protein
MEPSRALTATERTVVYRAWWGGRSEALAPVVEPGPIAAGVGDQHRNATMVAELNKTRWFSQDATAARGWASVGAPLGTDEGEDEDEDFLEDEEFGDEDDFEDEDEDFLDDEEGEGLEEEGESDEDDDEDL